jgi:hypothetical protein
MKGARLIFLFYSIIAGVQEQAKNRVHGWGIGQKNLALPFAQMFIQCWLIHTLLFQG